MREAAPAALETGRHVLEEDALTVMVNEAVMKKQENARMEVHDRFIDIHVPLSREEGFMWKERAVLEKPSEPFSREKDAQHYDDAPDTSFVVRPGQFAIFSRRMRMPAALGKGSF
ncbi:YhcH/YjgK/YiaL family protein [Akkermansia muciniphila]|nr:YhcH/YjgK/YiaL family protein [Akkermansia muciniphila]